MIEKLKNRIQAARQKISADLVLKHARVVNVFNSEIQESDVAIYDGIIIGMGPHYRGRVEMDLRGKYLSPGFIDGHIHIESTMLGPTALTEALLPHGTTTIISDPHEIANVMGLSGIRFMLSESRDIRFDVFFMAPSCVPATHLETSGSILDADDLAELADEPRILGLAEIMNVPGVLLGNQKVLEKIALFKDKILDGHCPSLKGHDLNAYLTAGIRSDHETICRAEALEKLALGMFIMIREGSSAKNLEELIPLVNPKNSQRFCIVSDDLHAEDIYNQGHLDFALRKAVKLGLDPVTAIQLISINPAQYFGLSDRGAIAPGWKADLVVLDDLEQFNVSAVYKNGNLIVDRGKVLYFPVNKDTFDIPIGQQLKTGSIVPDSFKIPYHGGKSKIIELVPGQIITRMLETEPKSEKGFILSDVKKDILKLAVVERHRSSGQIGLGLVKGFGLRRGALASSVAHDSHNIIATGINDEDLFRAIEAVRDMGGGLCVVCNNQVLAQVSLDIAGLMTSQSHLALIKQLKTLKTALLQLECKLKEPFMALSFLSLPVIPELRLTDRGLVDVNKFKIIPLTLSGTSKN